MNRFVKNNIVHVSLLVILLLTQVGFNFPSSSHHNDKLVEIWGTELLNSLQPRSILILCGISPFAVYYLHLIKGLRQDVRLYDRFSFWTKDNLYGPELLFKRTDKGWTRYRTRREQQLINTSLRPIYYTCKDALDEQNTEFSITPFVFRVDKKHLKATEFAPPTVSEHLLNSFVNGYPKSGYWLDRVRGRIFIHLISYYGGHNLPEVDRILNYLVKSKFYTDAEFILTVANNLSYFKNYELARKYYERAEGLSLEAFSPTNLAAYCHILANARDYDKALGICIRQEQSSSPCEINTLNTQERIAAIYKERGEWSKVAEYSRKIIECQPNHKIAQKYLKLATERATKVLERSRKP